jgi:poly(3-hydroxyalkanoate) synthetase
MSWQQGQQFGRAFGQGRPLAAMSAAVLAASQKNVAEQGLKELLRGLEQVPGDVDWHAFQAGMARYAASTEKTPRAEYPVLAQAGRFRLLDAGGAGAPVVLVPSMVNRGYILDLYPGHSLVEYLRDVMGLRVLLVDWGEPVAGQVATLDDVITRGLEPLVQAAAAQLGPVRLLGYCMGGLLALAAAVRLGPQLVTKLAVAAMPWDFSQTVSAGHMQAMRPLLEPWLGMQQVVPPEVMAQYFWSLDPWGPVRRVMAYGRETDPERLRFMTALEDWLADGIGLDGPVVQEMLLGWYADNAPMQGAWRVGGTAITPQTLQVPLWVCITQKDVLVPLNSSLPFIGQAKGAQVVMADTGHVGLVCGRRAKEAFFEPLGGWLAG